MRVVIMLKHEEAEACLQGKRADSMKEDISVNITCIAFRVT
jgi:hypothetical protein